MIRHIAMFQWKPGTGDDTVAVITDGLAALPDEIPEIRRFQFGPDIGVNEASWDFAVVAEFDDAAGYATYRDHPAHRAFIAEHITPHLDSRATVQYALP